MCYINEIDIKTTIKLFKRQIPIDFHIPVRRGFDYLDWPIIKPINMGTDVELEMATWGLVPYFVTNNEQLFNFRKKYTTLNARNDNLFSSNLYKAPAQKSRCLVLSTGFFEYRHVPRIGAKGQQLKAVDKYPYYIHHKTEPVMFMAGISMQFSNDDSGETIDTFSIITTEANELMGKIHNSKLRMPVILELEQAEEWLQSDLNQKQISELASIQNPNLEAWTIAKDFLTSNKPNEPVTYKQLESIE